MAAIGGGGGGGGVLRGSTAFTFVLFSAFPS